LGDSDPKTQRKVMGGVNGRSTTEPLQLYWPGSIVQNQVRLKFSEGKQETQSSKRKRPILRGKQQRFLTF